MKKRYISQRENGKNVAKRLMRLRNCMNIEDEDILVVDAGKYGFVKLQCYTLSYGFEVLDTYIDSNNLFEGL